MSNSFYISAAELITPAGVGIQAQIDRLFSGRTALEEVEGIPQGMLAEMVQLELDEMMLEKNMRCQDRATVLAVLLGRKLASSKALKTDCGVVLGSSRGLTGKIEKSFHDFANNRRMNTHTSPTTTLSACSAAISRDLKLSGVSSAVSMACASSMAAIVQGCGLIAIDLCSSMIAGGVEYANTPFTLQMLKDAKVYSDSPHSEGSYCSPGSPRRRGMVLSQGAAAILLESERNDEQIAEIVGWGASTELGTLTGISETGQGISKAINQALKVCKLVPGDIDFIVGHGAGTLKGDAAELHAYREIFSSSTPIVWHKWMFGHLLGAAAAASLILGVRHLQDGIIPPHPYFPCEHDMHSPRYLPRSETLLIVSLGFGGAAYALVVKKLSQK